MLFRVLILNLLGLLASPLAVAVDGPIGPTRSPPPSPPPRTSTGAASSLCGNSTVTNNQATTDEQQSCARNYNYLLGHTFYGGMPPECRFTVSTGPEANHGEFYAAPPIDQNGNAILCTGFPRTLSGYTSFNWSETMTSSQASSHKWGGWLCNPTLRRWECGFCPSSDRPLPDPYQVLFGTGQANPSATIRSVITRVEDRATETTLPPPPNCRGQNLNCAYTEYRMVGINIYNGFSSWWWNTSSNHTIATECANACGINVNQCRQAVINIGDRWRDNGNCYESCNQRQCDTSVRFCIVQCVGADNTRANMAWDIYQTNTQ